jgi:autotransporter-associated beta strand protein
LRLRQSNQGLTGYSATRCLKSLRLTLILGGVPIGIRVIRILRSNSYFSPMIKLLRLAQRRPVPAVRRLGLRSIALVLLIAIFSSSALAGTNGTWIDATTGGLWSNSANWSGGTIADGTDGIADFSTLNITADNTVHLDSARTIGTLEFGDTTPSNNWTLDSNGFTGNVLTLAVSSGTPVSQVHNQTATLTARLTANQGFMKSGAGTLAFTGFDYFYTGNTVIDAGVLRLSASDFAIQQSTVFVDVDGGLAFGPATAYSIAGLAGTNNFSLVNNGGAAITLTVGSNNASTSNSGAMTGAGSLTKTGSGVLTLSGANSYSGTTTVSAGTLSLGNANALENSTLTFSISNRLQFQPGIGMFTVGGLTTGALSPALPLIDTVGNPVNLQIGNNSSSTTCGAISGAGSLTKIGTGTLTLSGANTFTGGTTVNAGTLKVTGSLWSSASNKVFVAAGNDFSSASLIRTVSSGNSYAGLGSTASGGTLGLLGSAADIRAGMSGGNFNLAMQWRVRSASDGAKLGSDVLNLTGMSSSTGTHVQADQFALQMTYNPAALGGNESLLAANGLLVLGRLNTGLNPPNGLWQNAVSGNFGTGLPGDVFQNVQSSWDAFAAANSINDANIGNFLGSYGVDVPDHDVWAVLNHNSQFSVVPEPSSLILLAIGGLAVGGRAIRKRRRRRLPT